MAWIELHQAVWTHRKTVSLAIKLGLDATYAAAHIIRLWTWALDNVEDGDLSGLPPEVIAFGADWKGDPETFVNAAIYAKWLDETEEGLYIHDWEDYAGKLMERRAAERERSRKRRADSKAVTLKPPAKKRTTGGRPADDQQTTVGTVPNSTVPNLTNNNPPISPQGEIPEYKILTNWFNAEFGTKCRPDTYKDKINARLKKYTMEQIKEASLNMKKSPHMMGQNDEHRLYATLEYITRNEKNIDKWLNGSQPHGREPTQPDDKRKELIKKLYLGGDVNANST